jgi:prephenate dehydrogenase
LKGPIGIAGIGLIGGSFGLALRSRGHDVLGFDADAEVVDSALARGAISHGGSEPAVLSGAGLVILAVPLDRLAAVARLVAPHLVRGCVVIDVGSVKGSVVLELERALGPPLHYLGAHPMFGAEVRGIRAADPSLLEGAPFIVTPTPRTDPIAEQAAGELARELGMRPLRMSLEQHDREVAAVSHLVYLAGAALVRAAPNLDVAGTGFRDATRPVAAPESMWLEILRLNRESVQGAARRLIEEIEYLASLEGEALHHALSEARTRRERRFAHTPKP